MKKLQKLLSCILAAAMLLALAGCGSKGGGSQDNGSGSGGSSSGGGEIVIKYPTCQVGANTSAPVIAKLV